MEARNVLCVRSISISVKWPERESDHTTLYNVEKTSGAITLSVYTQVSRTFKGPLCTVSGALPYPEHGKWTHQTGCAVR
jgi:hypothetical protein